MTFEFKNGQTVTLINGRNKFDMKVIGQVKDYVALATDDSIEVYMINEYKGKPYLVTNNDGGPNWSYNFKVNEGD